MTEKKMSLEEGKELYEIGFHLISSLAAEQAQEEFSKLQDGLGKLAEVISAKEPELINLEYTMVKTLDRKHVRFDTAHFAYITFITSPDKVQSIKDMFDGNLSVLRHLIIKTTADAEESLIKVNEIFAVEEEDEIVEDIDSSEIPEKEVEPTESTEKTEEAPKEDELDQKIDELVS